jgi:ubiquinone/menaquinone biosynthesis C-methylase UbiE
MTHRAPNEYALGHNHEELQRLIGQSRFLGELTEELLRAAGIKPGMRVLDVGCGKGFLVKDLMLECPGLQAFGLDISLYALQTAPIELAGRLHLGTAEKLPFPDNSFDCVISLNTIHNFPRPRAIKAMAEIERVSKGSKSFVVVDSYRTPEQKEVFESWVLTAEFHDYPDEWVKVFNEAGYTGDWNWTIIE